MALSGGIELLVGEGGFTAEFAEAALTTQRVERRKS